jgi:glycosyltransferase involved in cell wall biosynthesis
MITQRVSDFLRRRAILIRDALHRSEVVRKLFAAALLLSCSLRPGKKDVARNIERLCHAAQLARGRLGQLIEKRIAGYFGDFEAVYRSNLVRAGTEECFIPKSIILKPWISEREKGVIFISFEEQWLRLFSIGDLKAFSGRYHLVVAPSWSPPHHLGTTAFPYVYPDKIFTLISNTDDLVILPRLSAKFVPIALYASSWVNPSWFEPVSFQEKDIDLVMVANFALYKRHFALFRALRDMPKSLRIVLIGRRDRDRTMADIQAEAQAFGVADRYELLLGAPDDVLFKSVARAKVSVILSRREGSCVAVAESMLLNTPVGLLADAGIGSKAFINDRTGTLLRERDLGAQLTSFIERAGLYQPRSWMLEQEHHCFGSTVRLNRALKEHALAAGQAWTHDLAVHQWRPDPVYVEESDRLRLENERAEVARRFGVLIGSPLKQPARQATSGGSVEQSS